LQWHLVCRYQWCREARMQAHPQKFWCGENPGKIPENRQIRRNLSKICENLGKTPENLGKLTENTAKMASNMLCFLKNWPPMSAESHENFILFRKRSSWEKFAQKVVQNFFGQVWGNSDKNPSRPQKFACSYSYGRCDPLIAQEAGLFLWCHVMMILQFTNVRFLVCRGRLRNLRADSCSS